LSPQVLIIGAGLSGLACALKLQAAEISFFLLEASDAPGGRVRTDEIDGFLLDRGFQVYLDAYPEAGRILDLPALDLRPFSPGALVFHRGKMHRVMDVFRRPGSLVPSALAPIGTISDKLVNNVCVLSDVSRAYAPPGQHLISVSVLGLNDRPDLPAAVIDELAAWFGPEVRAWRHLRTDRIEHALPEQLPGGGKFPSLTPGLHRCGDYLTSASIEGAIVSGHETAESLIRHFHRTT